MRRFHQLLLVVSVLTLSWLVMMAIHELGHVLGALLTGGTIQRVVLHPLKISRTEVAPNPHPALVVWLGPILGGLLPLAVAACVSDQRVTMANLTRFLAGFCLVANGGYIAFGTINGVGDSGEMLRSGSPVWLLLLFGAVTTLAGMSIWHRMGSFIEFLKDPSLVRPRLAHALFVSLLLVIAGMLLVG